MFSPQVAIDLRRQCSLSLSLNRVAFLMRTSFNMLSTNYKKQNEEESRNERQEMTQKYNIRQETETEKKIIEEVKRPRDRKAYLNVYYQQNKDKIKDQIKKNEQNKICKIRMLRELNNGLIEIKKLLEHQL
jgi:hypothetical protein